MSEKLIYPYFNNKFPEFVSTDHPVFKDFIEAYYEYLEKINTETSTNSTDLYKSLVNPGGLISNMEDHIDIDTTMNGFITYFRKQVIPIGIESTLTDPRFTIKKIRDVYLSKGTPKSFQLLFRLLYHTEIDFFEPQENIIGASIGNFVTLNVAYIRVTDFAERLSDITFRLSQLADDDGNPIGTIVAGTIVGLTPSGQQIVKIQLADDYPLELTNTYRVVDPVNTDIFIRCEPIPTIRSITVTDPGGLYSAASVIDIKSDYFGSNFKATPVTNVTGTIDNISIRNRGCFYKVGDTFSFTTDNLYNGSGGQFTVTGVDRVGRITEIDGSTIRSGVLHNGFRSSTFEDVVIPIANGGRWRKIPDNILYNPNQLDFEGGHPYLTDHNSGVGFQAVPVSDSIGTLTSLRFAETPYFLNDSDVDIVTPMNIVVDNIHNLKVNDVVSFQVFKLDSDGNGKTAFSDDSETLYHTMRLRRRYDQEYRKFYDDVNLHMYYSFDSDLFQWGDYQALSDSEKGLRAAYGDSDNDLNTYRYLVRTSGYNIITVVDSDQVIDAGLLEDTNTANNIFDSGSWGSDSNFETLDLDFSNHPDTNRDTFNAVDSDYYIRGDSDVLSVWKTAPAQTLTTTFYNNDFINKLDGAHYRGIIENSDSDVRFANIFYRERVPNTTPTNVYIENPQLGWDNLGSWSDTGFYGKIVEIDGKIVSVLAPRNRTLPTPEQIDELSKPKYNIVRLAKVTGNETETESGLMIQNVVAYAKLAKMTFTLGANTKTTAKFIDESGFLSSSSGGVLQDNSFYSNHTYILQSDIPIEEWRDKIKTIAHPAGKILYSELNVNQFVTPIEYNAIVDNSTAVNTFRFDSSLEHTGNADDTGQVAITADQTVYKTNAYEVTETINANDTSLKADSYSILNNVFEQAQYGNGFFDFEPVGYIQYERISDELMNPEWLAETFLNDSENYRYNYITTQENDGTGRINGNSYTQYQRWQNTLQDMYKLNGRPDSDYVSPTISQVIYGDEVNQVFGVWVDANSFDSERNISLRQPTQVTINQVSVKAQISFDSDFTGAYPYKRVVFSTDFPADSITPTAAIITSPDSESNIIDGVIVTVTIDSHNRVFTFTPGNAFSSTLPDGVNAGTATSSQIFSAVAASTTGAGSNSVTATITYSPRLLHDDSEIVAFNNLFFRFGDSDKEFSAIDYFDSDLRHIVDVDNVIMSSTSPNRFKEYVNFRETDFNTAMKEIEELSFEDGDVTYYDYEAYERKWNQINQQRTINTDGWQIPGATSMYLNLTEHYRRLIQTSPYEKFTYSNSLIKTPLRSNVWDVNNVTDEWVWNKYYLPEINNDSISVEIGKIISYPEGTDPYPTDSDYYQGNTAEGYTEPFYDPQVSMRNRRI